jgi:hypothetical protein
MTSVLIPNNWKPRAYQLPFFRYFARGGKRAVLMWPRRHGKDDACLHLTAIQLMKTPGTYWFMLPQYGQARKAIWDAVNKHTGLRRIDEAFPKEIRARVNESEMKIVFKNGSVWQVCGSDNYNALVGSNPAGIVFSEYALSDPQAWDYLSPILEENNGWAVFNSTVRGQNHFTQLAHLAKGDPNWFYSNVRASEAGVFTQQQLDEIKFDYIRRRGYDMGLGMFLQEYENDENAFVSTYNSVFARGAGEKMRQPAPANVPTVSRVAGIDLARFGGDNNVVFIGDRLEDGSLTEVRVESWAGMDAVFTQGKIADVLSSYRVNQAAMDGDGVGGPIIDNVRAQCDGRGIVFEEYHNIAISGPYGNRTTQGYFDLAREAEAGKIFLRDERVIGELGARLYEFNHKGQVVLQNKKEWRKESGTSPDFADAAVMASMILPLPKNFQGKGGRPAFARMDYDVI